MPTTVDEILKNAFLQLVPRADKSRLRLLLGFFAEYWLRVFKLRISLYDGDIEMATISDAVGFNSTIHMFSTLRDLEVFSDLTVVLGDAQQGCTTQMIADITGLPRETVRRKLKRLVESGYLTTTEDGRYIHRPGILLEEPYLSAIFELEQITLEFINRCLATGVGDVKVIRADDGDASAGQ